MSKKTMLLALAVASVTMFALPAASSATEIHLTGVTSFSGDSTAGVLEAKGEPEIRCETGHVTGTVDSGGTTGSITLDFTGCFTEFFGIPVKCHTAGAPNPPNNTISTGGTFHMITTTDGKTSGPAILVTANTVTIVCAGFVNTIVHGNVIGTITSPACGVASKTMTINYAGTTTQDHEFWTGNQYDLTATTGEGGAAITAVLNTLAHTESTTEGTLNCT